MKLTVIEANMTGLQHSVINRLMITMLSDNEKVESMKLYCSKEHFNALNVQTLKKIKYSDIKVLKPGKHRVVKFFLEMNQVMKIINKSNSDLIIFLSCFPNVHFFLTLFAKCFNKKLLIVTHGEAEGLIMKSAQWKIWSYPFWITKTFKLADRKNLYRLVLGKSIYDNVKNIIKTNNLYYIDHPYEDFKSENNILPCKKDNVYAYVGNCLEKKGGNVFVDASKKIVSNSKFKIIGAYDLTRNDFNENLEILSKQHQMLSYKDFNDALSSITYACYPYASNSYKFTASGAIFDAIKYLKPIIYIKNDYFDSIFENIGNIGYRCEDEEDFIKKIQEIDGADTTETYISQIENLKKVQHNFTKEKIGKDLNKIIDLIMENMQIL